MSTTIKVEHLARVEGHGGITVELDGDAVSQVRFDLFEGARLLESLIKGRSYEDVAQIVSRICAICSAAHSLTSIKATEAAFGVEVSPQTHMLRDLLYRGESIESHALHLFCLAAPDYLGYTSATALAADYPDAVKMGLRLKKLGNLIQDTIGGRAIHPVNVVPGGFGKLPSVDQLNALRAGLLEALEDCKATLNLLATLPPADFCESPTVFAGIDMKGDYGYYRGDEITVKANGKQKKVKAADYRSLTNEKAVPHAHAKHSSFDGKPFMVGALARLTVNAAPNDRAAEAIKRLGLKLPSGNPMDNNKAQAVELIYDVERALCAVDKLLRTGLTEAPRVPVKPKAGTGTAVTEAPRGILFHSYTYDADGNIVSGDVITPTAINAASIEDHFRHAVEQSMDKSVPALTRKLEMIARAYDPCISCSVHLIQKKESA